jgi:hypothetical protein
MYLLIPSEIMVEKNLKRIKFELEKLVFPFSESQVNGQPCED